MVPGGGRHPSEKQGAEHTLGGGVRGAGLELVDGGATSGAKDGSFGCLSGYMISKNCKVSRSEIACHLDENVTNIEQTSKFRCQRIHSRI